MKKQISIRSTMILCVIALLSFTRISSGSAGTIAGVDIVVSSITVTPENPAPNEEVSITFTILNAGTEDAPAAGRMYMYVNPADSPPTSSTELTAQIGFFNEVPSGKGFIYTLGRESFPADGVYPIYARVDVNSQITETNENNNLYGPIWITVGNGSAPDSYEPDGNCVNEATTLTVNGTPQTHNLNPNGDEDWYEFNLTEGVEYRLSANAIGADASRLVLDFYGECPDDPDGGFAGDNTIQFVATKTGVHKARVFHGAENHGSDTNYTIQIDTLASVSGGTQDEDLFEPSDDNCETANTLIPDGVAERHNLNLVGDVDYYQFRVEAGTTYQLIALGEGADADMGIDLLPTNCSGDLINGFSPDGHTAQLNFEATYSGIYRAKLYHNRSTYGLDSGYTIQLLTISPAGSATGNTADSDGDGIPDLIEQNGYDRNGDGTIDVDLPAMGANPNHKDIFIEIDYMVNGTDSYQPALATIAKIVQAFDQSPVSNPDGTTGIHLHVDYGPNAPLTWGRTQTWGTLSNSNALPYQRYISECTPEFQWSGVDTIKSTNFARERLPIFHYNIWGYQLCATAPGVAGISRNDKSSAESFIAGASDFLILPGPWFEANQTPTENDLAGVFMHELGHNLGLMHGGTNHENYKPNYLSVMNYSFTTRGLNKNQAWFHFDYSRYTNAVINENILNESNGLITGYGDIAQTIHVCNGRGIPSAISAIDWNCDGDTTDNNLIQDVNNSGSLSIIETQNDWDRLSLNGGKIGDYSEDNAFNIGKPLPMATLPDEYTIEIDQSLPVIPDVPFTPESPYAPVPLNITLSTVGVEGNSAELIVAMLILLIGITIPSTKKDKQ